MISNDPNNSKIGAKGRAKGAHRLAAAITLLAAPLVLTGCTVGERLSAADPTVAYLLLLLAMAAASYLLIQFGRLMARVFWLIGTLIALAARLALIALLIGGALTAAAYAAAATP